MVKRGIIFSVKVRAGAKLPKLPSTVFFAEVVGSQVIPEFHLCGGIGDSSAGPMSRRGDGREGKSNFFYHFDTIL